MTAETLTRDTVVPFIEAVFTRNASGEHPFAPNEEQFHQFSRHFQPPTPDEGFTLVIHDGA